MVAIGYLIYSLSDSFLIVAIGFTTLGFFNAFSNTGFSTFYQNNIPIHLMGRMTSVVGVLQSAAQIIFLLLIGVLGDIFPLRYTIVILAGLNLLLSILVVILIAKPGKQVYFEETVSS
ncbi:hypothetical protein [Bacillus sp. V3-13]|uniref:hypothetical protein n=1 Tax=Bacillus sp. V3-13 TaxID=2053728 RepID=UPI002151FFF4|nr:hypothetical protein [Bacillus sp. V3-13]